MANYQLEQTGAEVQAILNAVQSPDTTPVEGSSKLITSGGVQAAIATSAAAIEGEVTALGQKVSENTQDIADIRQAVNDIQPIVIEGDVTNAPDEEDITTDENDLLKFADRTTLNGMGYKILRRDKTFAAQVTDTNTIYEIRYDFDLGGASVTIPAGCVLKFAGGSIYGGSVSNLGEVINAEDGLKAEIISLSNAVKCFVASQYSVTLSSDPAYNQKALQAAINADIPIVIDTPNCDYDEGIEIAGPLYVATNRIDIKGVGGFSGGLVFPNSDGFVWNQKLYYFHNFFDCLTISANGYVFNFVNEVSEGVANPDRPYNIYQSRFTNLQVKSATKDCFYQGGVSGVGGDSAMVFQVYFGNIRLSTPRYGFNGINGQTDFVIEKLTDGSVPESFFYNTSPSVVRYVNSSFSRTKHFMLFGGSLQNFGIGIKCEFCSFEGYSEEIFKDDIAPNLRGYSIELNDCAISYYSADFPSGLNLYPITLSSINVLRMNRTKFPGNLSYASGYELVRANAYLDARSDTPFKVYYGAGASPAGYYLIEATTGRRSQRVGQYPNFVNEIFVPFLGGKAVSAEFISLYADSVSVDSTTTPAITKMMTKLTASANRSVDYITLSLFADEGGVLQSGYENFGKVLFFYNDSNYNITFNAGYANSIVDPTLNGLVMRPKEFMMVIYDNSKVVNKFVAVQRLNGLSRYGHTSERPSLTARDAGFLFYDRDILKMILWNGSAWVNMDGTAL